jgi:hypothetical protein
METSESVLKNYSDLMLCKHFWEFKNIILEVKLSNKYKIGNEKSLARKGFEISCLDISKS